VNRAGRATSVLVVLTVGCASGQAPARPATLPPGMSQAFQLFDFASLDAATRAEATFVHRCAAKKGYPSPPPRPNDSSLLLLVSRETYGPLTEADARRQGLHTGPVSPPDAPKQVRPPFAELKAFGDCVNDAEARLGPEAAKTNQESLDLINVLGNEMNDRLSPKVDASLVKERECVVAAGWQPSDRGKVDDLSVRLPELFGVELGMDREDAGRTFYSPTPREIDLALALLKCRMDMHLPNELLEDAKQVQLEVVTKYEQRIREVNARMQKLAHDSPKLLG